MVRKNESHAQNIVLLVVSMTIAACTQSGGDAAPLIAEDPATTDSVLSVAGYQRFLPLIYVRSNGRMLLYFSEALDPTVNSLIQSPETAGFSGEKQLSADCARFECPLGGSVTRCTTGGFPERITGDLTFAACVLPEKTISGRLVLDVDVERVDYSFSTLEIERMSPAYVLMTGSTARVFADDENLIAWQSNMMYGADRTALNRFQGSGFYENSYKTRSQSELNPVAIKRYATDYTLEGPETNGERITVSTRQPVTASPITTYYNDGVIALVGARGVSWKFLFDNGDPDSIQLDINESGTLSSFTLPTDVRLRFEELSVPELFP